MDKWFKGYIRWFDNLTGIGFVRVPELERDVIIHYSASVEMDAFNDKSLAGRQADGGIRITYEHLDVVEVQIIFDSHLEQVSKCKNSNWISREDLLSDALLNYLEGSTENSDSSWDNFILNNILTDIDGINKLSSEGCNYEL